MTRLTIQRLIAAPFLVLGGWCLVFPAMVERMVFQPAYQNLTETSVLMVGCFGAQAMLSGLFAAFSRFSRTTFLVYGIALLPFFWFNYWFVFVVPMFNAWLMLDFVSNIAMLALCVLGWRRSAPAVVSSTGAARGSADALLESAGNVSLWRRPRARR